MTVKYAQFDAVPDGDWEPRCSRQPRDRGNGRLATIVLGAINRDEPWTFAPRSASTSEPECPATNWRSTSSFTLLCGVASRDLGGARGGLLETEEMLDRAAMEPGSD